MKVKLSYLQLIPLGMQIMNSINAILASKTRSETGRICKSEIKQALTNAVDGVCDMLPGIVDNDD